jgi:hypothetical protein
VPGIRELLVELDQRLGEPSSPKLPFQIIGATALALQTGYERGTKDGDVLETLELSPVTGLLRQLAGKSAPLAAKHGVYLDLVAPGLPFLPQGPCWHRLGELNQALQRIEVSVLDVVDVVVSKLNRFSANDLDDIEAMIDRDLVPHDLLIARFRAAADLYVLDARASDLPRYVANLHRVERDLLTVPETEIELPSWI